MKKSAAMLYPRSTQTRQKVSLDGMWKFRFDPENKGKTNRWYEGISSNELMPVPASFQDFFTDKDSREYVGDFWYETEFYVSAEWSGKDVDIRFGGVAHRAVVYVNGQEITRHEGGFLPFCVSVTEVVNCDCVNRLVVMVNNELSEQSLPVGTTITLENGKRMAKPYFDFFNYAGILRPVNLVAVSNSAVSDFSVIHQLSGDDALVEYNVETTGDANVRVTVLNEEGKEVAEAEGASGVLKIPEVRLWKVRNAYLYRFVIRLYNGDALLDEWYDDIGIRTIAIRGTDFLINGEPVYFKGFGKHEDSEIAGRAYNPSVVKRDFELMKWIGANSFRTAHYPYSEEIYQMADREGFMVIDEVAAVGMMISQLNFVAANTGRNTGFFGQEKLADLLEHHLADVRALINRDKNHACVVAWSLFNEPETDSDNAIPYFKEVFDLALALDPQKRPRTFALMVKSRPENCKCHPFCDFICLNRYYGWYVMGGYEISDAEMRMRQEMDAWKEKELNKPFIFTEYGADTQESVNKLPSTMWSEEYQIEILEMSHGVFDDYDFVKGEQVWNFADFATTEGYLRVNGNKKGIFTRNRQPKAAAHYFKKRWESLPLDYKSK